MAVKQPVMVAAEAVLEDVPGGAQMGVQKAVRILVIHLVLQTVMLMHLVQSIKIIYLINKSIKIQF